MARPRQRKTDAAEALVAVAPLATRWIERLLAGHDPPLTVPQYLALRAIAREQISGTAPPRRSWVSASAASSVISPARRRTPSHACSRGSRRCSQARRLHAARLRDSGRLGADADVPSDSRRTVETCVTAIATT